MNNVTDISMIRLVEQGKKNPNEITDSLITAGYQMEFTPDQLVIATEAVIDAFLRLNLAESINKPKTSKVSGTKTCLLTVATL